MKKRVRIASWAMSAAMLFTTFFGCIGTVNANTVTTVKVDPNLQYQTFEGWGTSLAWFGDIIGGWSDENRNKIADQLFSMDNGGLGLNIVRYNIGGGENPDHEHMRPGGEVPGFKATEDSPYDWSADANQRWVLKAAQERAGEEFIAEAFSNSPPYWMTVSGCASGNTNASVDNLKADYYDDFADYLTEVVKYYRDNYGVTFRTLDPVNEPNTNYWGANGRQEGCHFDVASQEKIIKETYNKLSEKGLLPQGSTPGTSISAMDETSIDLCLSNLKSYSAETLALISQVNTHTYGGSKRAELNAYVKSIGKKLWMSEVGIGGSVGHDHNSMNPGMALASKITSDVTALGAEAWVYWQVVEDEANMLPSAENSNWGLIHADFDRVNENFYLTKQFYVMGNYSRFIRPGYKFIESGNSKTVAAYDGVSKKLVLVSYNDSGVTANYKFDLSKFRALGTSAEVYRTSGTENLAKLPDINISGKAIYAGLPADSVTTIVISDVELNEVGVDPTLIYYVDCGDYDPSVVEEGEMLGVRNSNEEQPYGVDPVTGYKWGYICDDGLTWARSEPDFDKFNSLRQYDGNTNGKGIHYNFEVDNGTYDITLGFLEPWGVKDRSVNIVIENIEKEHGYKCTSSTGETKVYEGIVVTDGELNISLIKESGSKPTISWIKVELAQSGSSISKISDVPVTVTTIGTAPVLPDSVTLTYRDNTTSEASVHWSPVQPDKYAVAGAFTVDGTVEGTNLIVSGRVVVVSPELKYYVDCSSDTSPVFDAVKVAVPGIMNSVTDQEYSVDTITGKTWGYTTYGSTGATSASDEYSSVRYEEGDTPGKGINYSFEIPNGVYDVDLGFKEIWSSERKTDIVIQGETKAIEYVPPKTDDLKRYKKIQVTNGKLSIDILRSMTNNNSYADPIVSWISISEHQNTAPVMSSIEDKTIAEGSQLTFKLNATDIDDDTLEYSADSLPAGANLDSVTDEFSWTPDYSQAGDYSITFTVTDEYNEKSSITVNIKVTAVTAQDIADRITSITNPAINDTMLALPAVPSGFSIAIKSSDNDVVSTDGTIIPPKTATMVNLVLEVTKLSDGTKGETGIISIIVPARAETARDIADSITYIESPQFGASVLTLPAVPDGYSIEIYYTDNPAVITTEGAISIPAVDTTVHLVLKVTKDSDGSSALTKMIPVLVPASGPALPTAQEIAAGITWIPNPARGATRLTLPAVPDGFSIAIKYSDNSIVTTGGAITLPSVDTVVNLVLEVTRLSDGSKAETGVISIVVPAKTPEVVNPPSSGGGSSSSGSKNSGSGSTTTTQPQAVVKEGVITPDKSLVNTTGSTNLLKINAADLEKAASTAKASEDGIRTVVVNVPKLSNGKGYSVQLPVEALKVSQVNTRIDIVTEAGTISIPGSMLNNMDISSSKTVEIVIEKVDTETLDQKLQKEIGNRPVVNISLKIDGKLVSWSNVNAPVTVSIPYEATEQELKNKENLTVYYISDDGKTEIISNARYDEEHKVVTFTTTHFSKYAIVFIQKSFDDLSGAAWAKKAIEVLASKGIVEGRTESSFEPEKNVTRGEFISWLVRTLNLEAEFETNFTDVKQSDPYYREIGVAKALGITAGIGNNLSGAGLDITRQDMMVMTARAIKTAKKNWLVKDDSALDKFTDSTKISAYAREAVSEMVASGIIVGTGKTINPKGNTTRAEAAAMLYKLFNK